MLNTPRAYGGMVTSPHHLASGAGRQVLEQGGNALEAMIAMAATIAVVYPHMNGIGGDGFWLCQGEDGRPVGIQACGPSGAMATGEFYADCGPDGIPARGGRAALTVAGTVAGWQVAHQLAGEWGGRMPLRDLLAQAVHHARNGVAVTSGQHRLTEAKLAELQGVQGFAAAFLDDGEVPAEGTRQRFPALAATLEHLAEAGLDDFYRGDVARSVAADLEGAGSPLRLPDLEAYRARRVRPLSVEVAGCRLFNMPPPTQGVSSLAILAVLDRLGSRDTASPQFVHDAVEATKQVFRVRNASVCDPDFMTRRPEELLAEAEIRRMASLVDRSKAAPWPHPPAEGDTIWMGAIDAAGRAVSFIQSIYWEYGSGVVCPSTGILWQNRGMSFSLQPGHMNELKPRRLPFHTLNPALAQFADGRVLSYGTMGGEGQPQTQAAVFARYAWGGTPLQQAVTMPRWLLGRTWGEDTTSLKLEGRFPGSLVEDLSRAGHEVDLVEPFSDLMGHAGAVVRHEDGLLEGAADPRSDGCVAAL